MVRDTLRRASLLFMLTALSLCFAAGCGDDKNDKDPEPCTEGSSGCACLAGGGCDDGLVCGADNTCQGAVAVGLTISDPDARACELLIVEGTATVHGATYVTGVEGALRRRAPNVALAIARTEDAAFPAAAATLTLEGASDGFTLEQSRCFDASGAEMQGVEVGFQ